MKTIEIDQDSTLVYSVLLDGRGENFGRTEGMWSVEVDDNKYIQLVEWQRKADLLQAELLDLLRAQ